MIKALIVEDDLFSASMLEAMLNENFANLLRIVGKATSIEEAREKIEEFQPDLVFLDVQLGDKSGFDFLNDIKIINFETIITTISKEYALNAFKANAVDFLLKPIKIDALKTSVEKVIAKIKSNQVTIPVLRNQKIGLPTSKGVVFVEPKAITYCEANNNYTFIHFTDGTNENISRTLKEVESVLTEFDFIRIHKSYLINFEKIKYYIKSEGGHLLLEGVETPLPISKNYKEELLKNLKMV